MVGSASHWRLRRQSAGRPWISPSVLRRDPQQVNEYYSKCKWVCLREFVSHKLPSTHIYASYRESGKAREKRNMCERRLVWLDRRNSAQRKWFAWPNTNHGVITPRNKKRRGGRTNQRQKQRQQRACGVLFVWWLLLWFCCHFCWHC